MSSLQTPIASTGPLPAAARGRVLEAAYGLFTRHGFGAVGVDTIIATAGVAKMTLYRHFRSKQDLMLAVLQRREDLWTHGWLETQVRTRAELPGPRLLTLFDLFDEWFHQPDFEGCFFINSLLEAAGGDGPIREASASHLANIRALISGFATEAGISDPDEFAWKWQILLAGSIVAANQGDRLAAARAREMAALLLESAIAG